MQCCNSSIGTHIHGFFCKKGTLRFAPEKNVRSYFDRRSFFLAPLKAANACDRVLRKLITTPTAAATVPTRLTNA